MTCSYLSGKTSRSAAGLAAAAVLAMTTGCSESSPIDPTPDPPVYQGALTPSEGFSGLEGGVVLTLLEGGEFEIALTMEGAPEPDEGGFPWILRGGSCAAPGDALGDWDEFPAIQLDAEGGWAADVEIALGDEAERYVVDIRRSEADRETQLACAEAERLEES
ncbi:MAG: hypothetical protein EA350_14430 [Gemmatimonadales bacterium]|nr:MAG: hypothetical protein EA350_14430 [Gemmatimonadales bacterium]